MILEILNWGFRGMLIGMCLNAHSAVLTKEVVLQKIKAHSAKAVVPAQIPVSIMVISAGLDEKFNEMSDKPLVSMQGIMGITCTLAKKHDKAVTDSNCIEKLHNSDYAIPLGINILTGYFTACQSDTKCTLKKWYGNNDKATEAFGLYKGLMLIFTKPVK